MLSHHFESFAHEAYSMRFYGILSYSKTLFCGINVQGEANECLLVQDKELNTEHSNESLQVPLGETIWVCWCQTQEYGKGVAWGAPVFQRQEHGGKTPQPWRLLTEARLLDLSMWLAGSSTALGVSSRQQRCFYNLAGSLWICYVSGASWDLYIVGFWTVSSVFTGWNVSN